MFFSKAIPVFLTFILLGSTQLFSQEAPLLKTLIAPVQSPLSSQKSTITKEIELIKTIKIEGNATVTTSEILQVLTLKAGDPITTHALNRNIKNIKSLGYFKEVTSHKLQTSQGTKLTFIVKENPKISTVEFIGTTLYTTQNLKELIQSKDHSIYNLNAVRKDIQTIEELYMKNGYVQAKIIKIENPKKNNDPLIFHVGEGIIENITITGNEKTQSYVILRELDIKPGQVLNEKELKLNLRRIYNLNYFTNIQPDFIPGKAPNTYNLNINLEEKPTNGSFSFGGGYSPSSGFSIFSDLFWDNIFGTGQLIMLKGNFGLGSTVVENNNSTYQFKYHNPWMWDKRKSFTFRTWLTDGQLSSFNPLVGSLSVRNEKRTGFDVGIGLPHSEYLRTHHTLKYETIDLFDSNTFFNIYSYTLGSSYDSRDYIANPKEGYHNTISLEQGFKFRHSALEFTQIDLTLRKFIPTFEKQVIALKGQVGFIRSPQIGNPEIFRSQWYYVGGSRTVRGYDDLHPFAYGDTQALATVEYRFVFTQNFSVLIFVDSGHATSSTKNIFHFEDYRIGKGIGARFNVPPLGPIKIDFGADDNGDSRIHFNIGYDF